ncbi:hypothetical protein GF360_00965 [candidate division WWE3 bacterium]|nr:hypothetical protein [candidate division WWE3 bacterium]
MKSIKKLTISQLDALNALLTTNQKASSSERIAENLTFGSGKSLSVLNSLASGKNPLVKKLGKISAKKGYLWAFNEPLHDREKIAKSVEARMEELSTYEVDKAI